MHDVAVFRISAENVRNDFTECLREDTLVDVLDSVMHILLGCRHATLHVPLIGHNES